MPDNKKPEYISNNSFMTLRVKIPQPFGGQYEDPLKKPRAAKDAD